jgi:DNA repair protein NreA
MDTSYIKDKGRTKHFKGIDPIKVKLDCQKKFNEKAKQDYFGASPNVFVGRFGYPNINVGFLNVDEYKENDEPLEWSKKDYGIPKIIDLRTQLVNSTFKANIKGFNDRLVSAGQEVSLSSKPVDVEIGLNKKPSFSLSLNQEAAPHGPNVKLKNINIIDNVKVPKLIDKTVSDVDFKAKDALNYLYSKGFDEHYLTKLISVGNLGVKPQRKMVPTRWSITAVDDSLGKDLLEEVRRFDTMPFSCYFGGYLGNYYLVLFFEKEWSYELFETVVSERFSFSTDYEGFKGRKEYAHDTAGGYYAARLGVLEKLKDLHKQGSVLCLRFIVPEEYVAPLGVWVVREATRKSLSSKPLEFGSKELMLKYAEVFVKRKFGLDLNDVIRDSKLLKDIKTQKKLFEF